MAVVPASLWGRTDLIGPPMRDEAPVESEARVSWFAAVMRHTAPIRATLGRALRETRARLDVSLDEVASQAGITASYLGRVERGLANPTMATVERIAAAVGLELGIDVRPPVFLTTDARERQRDLVHGRCSGYVERRLRSTGFETAREVPIEDGRYRGWIDLLAFDPTSGTLYIIEIKTRLDDIGAIERQMTWYEQHARASALSRGWQATRLRGLLVILATEENETAIRVNRDVLDRAFPARLGLTSATPVAERGLGLIDPRSRRRDWLFRPIADGRRTRAPFRDYADAAAQMRS
jgi:transcriptional regulator with XRE-family HTH domain